MPTLLGHETVYAFPLCSTDFQQISGRHSQIMHGQLRIAGLTKNNATQGNKDNRAYLTWYAVLYLTAKEKSFQQVGMWFLSSLHILEAQLQFYSGIGC